MEWTIEKVRQLPANNWLGIERISEHGWRIGADIKGGMVMITGDDGVLDYVKALFEAFNKPLVEEIVNYPIIPSDTNYKTLTEAELRKLIGDSLFGEKYGVA